MKLNQVIALVKGTKSKTQAQLTETHHMLMKTDLLSGLSRTYQPREDGGETYPAENKKLQLKAEDLITKTVTQLIELYDLVATNETANKGATADVVVDGTTLLTAVPVTYLLFLEKQLVDLSTFITKLPVLDPTENWSLDAVKDCWVTEAAQTNRTKKVPRRLVKAEATDKHPAQVDVYHEDEVVGTWTAIKFSGALPASRVRQLSERVSKLQRAVKIAREEANSITADLVHVGDKVLGYLFKQ